MIVCAQSASSKAIAVAMAALRNAAMSQGEMTEASRFL
jgi:hypothetical protein